MTKGQEKTPRQKTKTKGTEQRQRPVAPLMTYPPPTNSTTVYNYQRKCVGGDGGPKGFRVKVIEDILGRGSLN